MTESTPKAAPAAPTAEAPDAAFLAELKRKMAAVKAGQKESFTPEEIAYIKALKDKAAAAKPDVPKPTAQTAAPAAKPQVRETPAVTPDAPMAAPAQDESREAQIARLRALRAKQLTAEETASAATPKQDEKAPEQLRRVEKPTKQIKCPACAVPNPETNGQCYICGTRLK